MILEMHGISIAEGALSESCGTTAYGTSADDLVKAASNLGLHARKEYATLDDIRNYLSKNIFPILFINLLVIDGYNSTHAVIAEQATEEEIRIIDPRKGERMIDLELFKYSWQRAKNIAIIVQKP
jgi:ABC-type bacteriocin/lantibiotic exporter with double-glycine peptidase domain